MNIEVKQYLDRNCVDFESITIGTVFIARDTSHFRYIKVTKTSAFNISFNKIDTLKSTEPCYVYKNATFCFDYEIINAQYKDTNVMTDHVISKLRYDTESFKEMEIGDIFITENHDLLNKPTNVNINNNIYIKIDTDKAFLYSITGCEIINSRCFQNMKLFVLHNAYMELVE